MAVSKLIKLESLSLNLLRNNIKTEIVEELASAISQLIKLSSLTVNIWSSSGCIENERMNPLISVLYKLPYL